MLWDLIARRFLAVLSAPALFESITLQIKAGEDLFTAKGSRSLSRGWKELDRPKRNEEDGEQRDVRFGKTLPEKGELLNLKSLRERKGMTSPPARYTEASLLTAMENPSSFLRDKSLQKSLKQGGLGTPATRAEIIEKLIKHYYMERQGREIHPTLRGEELMDLVPEELQTPDLTARWEESFTAIAEGREKSGAFRQEIRKHSSRLVSEIKNSERNYQPKESGGKPCPFCGRSMITTRGKKGQVIQACLALSCGYEEEENRKGSPYESGRPSRKEKALNHKLIRQYSDDSKETVTLADMIKISEDRRKKKK